VRLNFAKFELSNCSVDMWWHWRVKLN
jgi:hypothetical protein